MDLHTLQYLAEDRFTLYAVPAAISLLLQLAGQPDPTSDTAGLTLRVGHLSKTFRQFLKATINIFNSKSKFTFPSWVQWKPIFTFQFIHNDVSHFVGNFLTLTQAIVVMKFPSWAGTRGWRRGGFVSFLLTSGSWAGAWAMDVMNGRSGIKMPSISSTSSNSNNNNESSSISNYIPQPVSSVVNWFSDQLPPSNWHNNNNNSDSGMMIGGGDGSNNDEEGITSKISDWITNGRQPTILMMGISSATFSVIGYNLSYNPRTDSMISAAMMIGHTVLGELTRRRNKNELVAVGTSDDAIMTAHMAHLGGFLWGVFVGYVCRSIEKRRRGRFLFRFNEENNHNNGNVEVVEDDRGNRGRVLGGGARRR